MPDCRVCSHPSLADIHRGVDAGGGVNATAEQYGISPTTLKRHLKHRSTATPTPTVHIALVEKPCMCCRHPRREEIERWILAGDPDDAISKRLGGAPSNDTIRKHRTMCIREMISEAQRAGIQVFAGEAKQRVRGLVVKAERLIEKATEEDDSGASKASFKEQAACLNAAKGVLELLAKLTGELGPDVEVKILATPEWRRIQERLGVAVGVILEKIPDPMARAAALREFAAAMREVDGGVLE